MPVTRGRQRQRKLPKGDPQSRVHRPPVRPADYQLLERLAEREGLSVAAALAHLIRAAAGPAAPSAQQ